MGVIAEGILMGCQGLFTPVSLGYPLSVFNKHSTLKERKKERQRGVGKLLSISSFEHYNVTVYKVLDVPCCL